MVIKQHTTFMLYIFLIALKLISVNCDVNVDSYESLKVGGAYKHLRTENEKPYDAFSDLLLRNKPSYSDSNPSPRTGNSMYYAKVNDLPRKSIYCTRIPRTEGDPFHFLMKYYNSIKGTAGFYTYRIECVYPRSVENPELGDDDTADGVLTTAAPKLKAIDKFRLLMDNQIQGISKGERPKLLPQNDLEALVDEMMDEIFHHLPTTPSSLTVLEASSPNGIICEYLQFQELDANWEEISVRRPVCYPVRPPPPPVKPITTTTSQPLWESYGGNARISNACSFICFVNVLYRILPCCRI